jgi:mRNA interferase MazF
MAHPNRGEIWLVDMGTGQGHEQAGRRPALVVSDDSFNHGLAGLVMVLPLSSKVQKSRNIPAHIPVAPPEGGLKTPSVILCDQLRTISKDRLANARWGTIAATTLVRVETALRMLLRV